MASLAGPQPHIRTGVAGQSSITPTPQELKLVNQLKVELGTALTTGRHAAYPEVVGDINLLRHIRGLQTVKEAKKKFLTGLDMRVKYALDDIRDEWALKLNEMGYDNMWRWRNLTIDTWAESCGSMGGGPGFQAEGWPDLTLSGHMYNCVSIADWQPGSKTEGLLSRTTEEETRRWQLIDIVVHQMRFDLISRREGKMTQVCFIWDFKGVTSMFQMQNKEWKRRIGEMDALRGELHIEYLARFYLINASWIVRKLYALVQIALPKRTADKVVVVGSDWREVILQEFPPKVVALIIKTCNKKGSTEDGEESGNGQDDLIGELHIKAGSKKEVIVDLDDATEVSWNFKATSRDINFSATVTGSDGPQSIVTSTRCTAEQGTITGQVKTSSGGILVLCWDNSHSWMWGNGVQYEVLVVAKKADGETKH